MTQKPEQSAASPYAHATHVKQAAGNHEELAARIGEHAGKARLRGAQARSVGKLQTAHELIAAAHHDAADGCAGCASSRAAQAERALDGVGAAHLDHPALQAAHAAAGDGLGKLRAYAGQEQGALENADHARYAELHGLHAQALHAAGALHGKHGRPGFQAGLTQLGAAHAALGQAHSALQGGDREGAGQAYGAAHAALQDVRTADLPGLYHGHADHAVGSARTVAGLLKKA